MNFLQELENEVQELADSRTEDILNILLNFKSLSDLRLNNIKCFSVVLNFAYDVYKLSEEHKSDLSYFENTIKEFIVLIKELADFGYLRFECQDKIGKFIDKFAYEKYHLINYPFFPYYETIKLLKNKDNKNKIELFLLDCLEVEYIPHVIWNTRDLFV